MVNSSLLSIGCTASLLVTAAFAGPVAPPGLEPQELPRAQGPSGSRHVVQLPTNVATGPRYPDFNHDGSLVFAGLPNIGGRSEIYQAMEDGSQFKCLSCGLSPAVTANLSKPFAFKDGSNRFLVRVGTQARDQGTDSAVLEYNPTHPEQSLLVNITVPTIPGIQVIQAQREIRIAPDGQMTGWTSVILDSNYIAHYVNIVGTLRRVNNVSKSGQPGYTVDDPRVVSTDTELKHFSAGGKKLIVATFNGVYEQGNADGVEIDLSNGNKARVTTNIDYDEDISDSPNGQWLNVGSSRTLQFTTGLTQIKRPTYVPAYVVGPMFTSQRSTCNQQWAISRADELAGEEGIQMWVSGDGYTSLPVGNWKDDGSAIVFWESQTGLDGPGLSRIVVYHLPNDGNIGRFPKDVATPKPTWAPTLAEFQAPGIDDILPSPGIYNGRISGTVIITDQTGSKSGSRLRTVTYNKFQFVQGQFIDGTETSAFDNTLANISYSGSLTVTDSNGQNIGSLSASNVSIIQQTTMYGSISSVLHGEIISMASSGAAFTFSSSPITPVNPF
ncbi:hypothetical protein JX265_012543 [Neoarthrinium moseri]|uniref:Uncharacterized protein n=1 Tax=Neoarthrinium moseri TaxID=1658444 RepID=A0A9P9WAP8_9PEZI|nr:hypothetical protein JX266_012201 [Neoarthrinium moseri]KAI1854374.1 hypothetical protein JX265_012543 [Neoarthrinium moseri]